MKKRFSGKIISIVLCLTIAFSAMAFTGCVEDEPVKEKTLTKIEVQTPPLKTQYHVGETFDKRGMRIVAFYANDEAEVLADGWTFAPTTPLTDEDKLVTVTYEEGGVTKTCTQAIEIVPEELTVTGIKITVPPTKTEYVEGEKFDTAGMEVRTILSDDSVGNDITAYVTYEPFGALTVEDKEITVKYSVDEKEFSAKQAVTVSEGVATITFGGGSYQKAHDIILGENESSYELSGGLALGKWDFNGTYKDSPFIRAKVEKENQSITFTLNFSGVEDKSDIGFSVNMIKTRPNALIQVSTDKENWDDLGYQKGTDVVYNSDYAETVTSLRGRAVSDPNLFRLYYSLADYADEIGEDGLVYVRFGFTNEYENSLSGPAVGSDVIDGVCYYEKLTFDPAVEHVKYTLTLGDGVSFADGSKSKSLRPGRVLPKVKFDDETVDLTRVTWKSNDETEYAPGTFKMPERDVTLEYIYNGNTYTVTLGDGMTFAGGIKTASLYEFDKLPEISFENADVDKTKVYFIGSNGTVWANVEEFAMPNENITLNYVSVMNPYIGKNGYSSSFATSEGQYLIGDGGYSHQPSGVTLPNEGRGTLVATADGKLAQLYNLPKMVDGYHFRLQTTPRRASNTEYTYNIDYTFYNMGDREITITVYQVNSGNNTAGCKSGTVTLAAGEHKTVNLTEVGFAGKNNFLTYFVFNGAEADNFPIAIRTYITPVAVAAA